MRFSCSGDDGISGARRAASVGVGDRASARPGLTSSGTRAARGRATARRCARPGSRPGGCGCGSTAGRGAAWRACGSRGIVLRTISATRACGPLLISRMRSASRIASSTSCVIMKTVWCVSAQMRSSSSWIVPRVSASSAPNGSSSSSILRLDREGARDAHALLHAAGQLRRLLVDAPRRGRPCRRTSRTCSSTCARLQSGHLLRTAKAMLLRTRQPRHQRMALEHHAALQARAGDLAAVHEDVAGAGAVEARPAR